MYPVKDASTEKIKYTGRSRGIVIDNRDPLQRGRIRVNHPLLGSTTWIPYLREAGTFSVPGIGNVVYIETDAGVYTHPVASGNLTIGPDSDPILPNQFQRDIPTNRGLFTPGGHLVELDDGVATLSNAPVDNNYTTTSRGIRITSIAGNKIWISEDPSSSLEQILIQDVGGNTIKLDYSSNSITINSIGTLNINADNAITIQTNNNTNIVANGHVAVQAQGNITLDSQQEIDIQSNNNTQITVGGDAKVIASGKVIFDGTEIDLGASAIDYILKGTTFQLGYNAHTHLFPPGTGAPTGPPIVPSPPTDLSLIVKTE